MRHTQLLPLATLSSFLFLACASSPPAVDADDAINAEIGDESFQRTFGRSPTAVDEDDLRIATHLRFVEATLRARDVSHLTAAQQTARVRMLDRLNAYWRGGAFPRNAAGTPRVPRFVEPASEGAPRRVCAVGAIAEPDLSARVIDAIASRYEHDYIASIHDPTFAAWAASSGLTLEELAMIQPSYHWMERPRGELTEAEIRGRLSAEQGQVNQCVYDALSPREAHPTEITTNLVVAGDGSVRDVVVNGTTSPRIRTCVERLVSSTSFRATATPKRAFHAFRIVGPRAADGSLESGYLPIALQRGDAGVDRCGSGLTVPEKTTLFVRVRIEAEPEGVFRVHEVRGDVEGTPLPRSITSCITRAVEGLAAPTFRGSAREHQHVYTMHLASF